MADTVRGNFPTTTCSDCGQVGEVCVQHWGPLVPSGAVGFFCQPCLRARSTDSTLNRPVRPLGQMAEVVLCPRCKKPAVSKGAGTVIDDKGQQSWQEVWGCPHGCKMEVPYSGDDSGEWPVEFTMVDGAAIFARPAADWFA